MIAFSISFVFLYSSISTEKINKFCFSLLNERMIVKFSKNNEGVVVEGKIMSQALQYSGIEWNGLEYGKLPQRGGG